MNSNYEIYRSENPKPEDVSRLDGFVKAMKETGVIDKGASTDQAVEHIQKMRAQTSGAFGRPSKP